MTKSMKQLLTITAMSVGLTFASASALAQVSIHSNLKDNAMQTVGTQWDKIFPQSDQVTQQKVQFKNRYGITLVADLYLPKNRTGKKLPAIAVAGAFGAVKEQSSGLYAQELAKRGFATLAFDPSFTGESGGEPRNVASPDINTEDFSAAVDFLSNQDFIDAESIGVLGICGWGGMALNVASMDTRIKATATSTMYDMSQVMANGYNNSVDEAARYAMLQGLNAQRSADFKAGEFAPSSNNLPEKLSGEEPWFVKEYWAFYKTPRGFHPRAVNSNAAWTATTPLSFINMPLLQRAGEIQNPVLVVHGEKAHSRYFSEDAFKKLKGDNKELYIVPNATHVDLYDYQSGKIPFDKFEQFFKANLK
ncbi:alpha/beta hydrolase [Pasteurellaceae bacterium UScroc12]|nr:alpha/beta hydrolase [Pasteurellaceae bacterium USgator41]TNG96626.1 alpha/beta hydrolase [Pasteurellaceae bacterium UScroc31]TNG96979.1 alpha/beta hydrolase [Pasteurellaceae bacterium UScroc12]